MPKISGRFIAIADGLLSAEECTAFIQRLDKKEDLHLVQSSLADYNRNIMVSPEWAVRMYERVRPYLPLEYHGTHCNTWFRFSKYHEGQQFKMHRDGVNQDARGYRTKLTINIFLNDAFEGGETDFFDEEGRLQIRAQPAPGRGAIFDREIVHRGNVVQNGYKYLLRTDVMVPNGR